MCHVMCPAMKIATMPSAPTMRWTYVQYSSGSHALAASAKAMSIGGQSSA